MAKISPDVGIVEDATCLRCGCLCDDIRLQVEDDCRITAAGNACQRGEEWFLNSEVSTAPSCRIDGRPASLEAGYERAAEILTGSRYPLVFGLAHATCEAQQVAISIADWIGACVDTNASTNDGATALAIAEVGAVTATLGEVANRGDLVIFWRADPAEHEPRHFERYSLAPAGMFVPGGRADRTCVVVDGHKSATADHADLFLAIKPGCDFEALWTLRGLAAGVELDNELAQQQTGVALARWQELFGRMKAARYGVIIYGPVGNADCEALLELARDLNRHTRFVALPMGAGGNAAGAENVLAWRTGYPLAVNFARGYPRFGPGEYTAADVLARGEADAALVVGGDPLESLPHDAAVHLRSIPFVALSPAETATTRAAAVAFTVAKSGINTGGTVRRVDGVPIPLRAAFSSTYPSEFQMLGEIEKRVVISTNSTGFDEEIAQTYANQDLMSFLDEQAKGGRRIPLHDAKAQLGL